MKVSVGVQAVIIDNNKILTIKKQDDDSGDATYILPGGKQEFGETLEQAVCREVFEDVGIAAVNVDDFLFLRSKVKADRTALK